MADDLTVSNLFNFTNHVVLVTGGASGLGEMAAQAYVQNGARVIIASRKEAELKKVTDRLNQLGPGKCEYIVADLKDKAGCVALAEEAKRRTERLTVLINNSGATWGGSYYDFPESGWDKLMSLNVKSIFYLTVYLEPLLLHSVSPTSPSHVINIASMAGIQTLDVTSPPTGGLAPPGQGTFSYGPSKAACIHLTKMQANEEDGNLGSGDLGIYLFQRPTTIPIAIKGRLITPKAVLTCRETTSSPLNSHIRPSPSFTSLTPSAGTTTATAPSLPISNTNSSRLLPPTWISSIYLHVSQVGVPASTNAVSSWKLALNTISAPSSYPFPTSTGYNLKLRFPSPIPFFFAIKSLTSTPATTKVSTSNPGLASLFPPTTTVPFLPSPPNVYLPANFLPASLTAFFSNADTISPATTSA
ncbi:hypothetical protein GRF29_28g2119139 [Pseudopithomyces chartarum]|uniref:NAD(P)-binding protein n=1 Tax=Pseudopithomyces chartarum TaxID=1892770 RepID=A0AAN6M1I0_9PLEO|nr:hypothetical protein GRF29_28g2119139 [Pseudopithomyces chartarum]